MFVHRRARSVGAEWNLEFIDPNVGSIPTRSTKL